MRLERFGDKLELLYTQPDSDALLMCVDDPGEGSSLGLPLGSFD